MTPAQNDTLNSLLLEVQNYLRDFPELNRMVEGYETSPARLRWYVPLVLDDIAATPPPLGFFEIDGIPRSILLKGIVAEVLVSLALLNLRNSMRYTHSQVTVDLDKHQYLLAVSNILKREYEQKKLMWKVSMNISRAMGTSGGVHSEYYYINYGFYGNFG